MKSSPVWAANSAFDKTPLPMNVFFFCKMIFLAMHLKSLLNRDFQHT